MPLPSQKGVTTHEFGIMWSYARLTSASIPAEQMQDMPDSSRMIYMHLPEVHTYVTDSFMEGKRDSLLVV